MASASTDVDMTSKSEPGSAPGDDVTQILSESRTVRVVLYSSTPAETEYRFWIDPDVTFGGVAKALAKMYPSQELVVLQANWGPRPSWTESHPDSPIGSTCRVLYAILKDQAKPYTVGVVRTSLSDYPIPIYVPASKSSMTLLGAVIASYPKLTGQVKSIVLHLGDHDLQDAPWGDDFAKGQPYPAAPFLIATVDEPSKEFLDSSLYEPFSLSSPKASTSSNSDGLIPPLLQISFAECKLLVQRAYELDVFPLRMIHLSEAIFHVIISLARSLTPVFENASSSIGAALSAEDDLADHLRVAPLLCRQLEELLNTANGIMDNLELGGFNREGAQDAIEKIFATLCGDLPGAVTVRCSEKDFERFGGIDCDGLDTLPLDTLDVKTVKTYRESIMDDRRVVNVDSIMDLDYDRDVRNLPDPSSWRSPWGKGGISETASTLRYLDSGKADPTTTSGAHSRTLTRNSEAHSPSVSPPSSPSLSPHSSPRALSPGGRGLPFVPEVVDAEGKLTLSADLEMSGSTDAGHQDASSPAGPGHKATRKYSKLKPRDSRKPKNNDPHDIALRISYLPSVAKRLMEYYAGNVTMARTILLERLENYQHQSNDSPIVRVGTEWICGICRRGFKTLQKAAIHLISNEWSLRLWHCLEVGCGRVYASPNELTRHMKDLHRSPNVPALLPPQNTTKLPGAVSTPIIQTAGTNRPSQYMQVTQGLTLTAMAASSSRHVPASAERPSPNPQQHDVKNNQRLGFVDAYRESIEQNPQGLPEATYPLTQSWGPHSYQHFLYPYTAQVNEQPVTSWGNSMQYPTSRRPDHFEGLAFTSDNETTELFSDSQVASTSQQPPIRTTNAPQPPRWSARLRGHPENRTIERSTSSNRPATPTPPPLS